MDVKHDAILPSSVSRLLGCLRILWWALRSNEDIFQLHDPDLLPVGAALKLFGRRVVYDVHDDYQATIRDRLRAHPRLASACSYIWWWFERQSARLFDGIIVADRHLAGKFASHGPVILGNYPPLAFAPQLTARRCQDTFNLIYVGGVNRARGLGCVLEALRRISDPNIRLHVIGAGRDAALVEELGNEQRVVLHGTVNWTELHRYYAEAHVGLALYQPLEGFMYSPGENAVKVLEYMAAGVPVLCSDFPGLRAFVEGAGAGITCRPDDPDAIVAAIRLLMGNDEMRRSLGATGRRLFEESYHWEKHEGRLIQLYERVLNA